MTKKQAWIGFWILAIIWGSSFLFIRIGVEQLTTFQVVFIRTGIAAVGLNIVAYMRGKHLPTDWKGIRDLLILGIVNTVFPFILITWGEKSIESSLAAILQGTAALFTMVVAHFVFADERMTLRKIAGLVIGFLGVVILASRSTEGEVVPADATLHPPGPSSNHRRWHRCEPPEPHRSRRRGAASRIRSSSSIPRVWPPVGRVQGVWPGGAL